VTPEVCPNCGAEVPDRAEACPECGADESTGWSEAARYEAAGLPDDSFDYDEYVKREFHEDGRTRSGIKPLWQIVAVIIVIGFICLLLRGWF
jgi:hypothetical protein